MVEWYCGIVVMWCGTVVVWYCGIVVGDIMLGDDNAAAKWATPASGRWSPDGEILFLGSAAIAAYYQRMVMIIMVSFVMFITVVVIFWQSLFLRCGKEINFGESVGTS